MKTRVRSGHISTVLLPVLLISAIPAKSATLEVCQPAGTCAYDSILEAVGTAADGDTVLVGDGTYGELVNFANRTITIESVNGPGATTLDGGGAGSVVVFSGGEGPGTVLRGFTITNGEGGLNGGGVYVTAGASPLIDNCIVRENTAANGGGVHIEAGASSTIENCSVRKNTATMGGGIFSAGSLTVSGSIVEGNSASHGGGIHAEGEVFDIVDSTVRGNASTFSGGGLGLRDLPATVIGTTIDGNSTGNQGGGLFFSSSLDGIVVEDSTIEGNTSLYGHGGGAYLSGTNNAVRRSVISGNSAFDGAGGILASGRSGITIEDSTISGNSSPFNSGGGMIAGGGPLEMVNCTVTGNFAHDGGGLWLGWLYDGRGHRIVNTTVAGNRATLQGGGIYQFSPVESEVSNTILWFNSAGDGSDSIFIDDDDNATSTIAVTYSDVEGGWAGEGNIAGEPLFSEPRPATAGAIAEGNYSLTPCSPCINAGTFSGAPGHDIEGDPRPFGGAVDMGADESVYDGPVGSPPVAADDGVLLDEDSSAAFDVLLNDSGVPPLNVSLLGGPGYGELEDLGEGGFNYVPSPNFNGEDGFHYLLSDGLCTAAARVRITVRPVYDPPFLVCKSGCPSSSIGETIDLVGNGDTILVHPGTYQENIDFSGKNIVIRSVEGPEATVIDGSNPVHPYQGSVVKFESGESRDAVLEGFTLTGGTGTWGDPLFMKTGAMFSKGGGIYCRGSSPIIRDCTIRNNHATSGGGVYMLYSSALITSSTIESNVAEEMVTESKMEGGTGGGIYSLRSDLHLEESTVRLNTAVAEGISNGGKGGGISVYYGSGRIDSSRIVSNLARGWLAKGGGIFSAYNGHGLTIRDSEIRGNHAEGLFSTTGGGFGGGLNSACTPALIVNTNVSGNMASQGDGGGIFINVGCGYKSELINSTITGNVITTTDSRDEGGGIYVYFSNDIAEPYYFDIVNSIVWGNVRGVWYQQVVEKLEGITRISYSNVQGGDSLTPGQPWPGNGNINENPLFMVPVSASTAPTDAGDFHLGPGSPCIDSGTNGGVFTDIDGDARPMDVPGAGADGSGSEFDMGSDEFPGQLATGPYADFTVNPNPAFAGESVSFDGSGSYHWNPAIAIASYEWDFNYDGSTFTTEGTGRITNHVFSASSTYYVALRVTDDAAPARTDIAVKRVEVGQPVDNVIFADDFTDGLVAGDPDWDEVRGIWKVVGRSNKVFVSNYQRNNKAVCSDGSLADFSSGQIETLLKMKKPFRRYPNGRIIFGYQDPRNYRYVELRGGARGRINIGQKGDFGGDDQGVKASRQARLNVGRKWHHLRADLYPDGTVNVSLKNRNGQMIQKLTHTFPAAEAGQVGYQALRAKTLFDDFVAREESVLP